MEEAIKTCRLRRTLAIMMALIIFLVASGSTPRIPAAQASGGPTSPLLTMTASSTVAPERLVMNGQYADDRFIDMMVPHHLVSASCLCY